MSSLWPLVVAQGPNQAAVALSQSALWYVQLGQAEQAGEGAEVVATPRRRLEERLSADYPVGPTVKRHRSQQVVATPWDFISAVNRKFGNIAVDLAATDDNHKAPLWITPEQDTFTQNWAEVLNGRLGWLNPEFDPMKKWASKCALEQQRGAEFLMLSPASVATNWFWDFVQPFATVYCVAPRIIFVGSEDPYPKDLILSHYCANPSHELQRWNWKEDVDGY